MKFLLQLYAYLNKIPIGHCGGEVTRGSMDDGFRHSITKFSYLHFVATNNSFKFYNWGEQIKYI